MILLSKYLRICLLAAITSLMLLSACSNSEEIEKLKKTNAELKSHNSDLIDLADELKPYKERLDFLAEHMEGITATLETNMGAITVEFYPRKAPIHVFAFITRAECGYYDGVSFHRVIKNFMIQGGDPNSKDNDPTNDGQGGPIVSIPHEFNDLKHEPGILSMARVSNVNMGAGSQFFIMHNTYPSLDGEYTVFGKVTKGLDVVDKIATTQTNDNDRPLKPVIIKKVTVQR